MPPKADSSTWLARVEEKIARFCREHRTVFNRTERELAASFEIGCLHMLLNDYAGRGTLRLENLTANNEFRYLTTPSGNPDNFSWVVVTVGSNDYHIRQQVRLRSHLHPDIAFSPDIVVLLGNANILDSRDPDFAGGKRRFFTASTDDVVAAHECKSLTPFPELLVSFVGMLTVAHKWLENDHHQSHVDKDGQHLAPCLFVGGSTSGLQRRMIRALEELYPINILTGLHDSFWRLSNEESGLNYLSDMDALLF